MASKAVKITLLTFLIAFIGWVVAMYRNSSVEVDFPQD